VVHAAALHQQVDWLLSIFDNSMPKSYHDILPSTGKSYWHSADYLGNGAFLPDGTRIPIDSHLAIQERTMTHKSLNLYDGGLWAIALTLNGLGEVAGLYHNNILATSSTGANPTVGMLSVRAWNPTAQKHPT
jgi:hypothetical protein